MLGHGAFRITLGNGAQIGSGELAVARGNRFAFVADMLGCARLVNIDMPAIGAHDALPRAKRMCDERDVGLRSSYDVVHRGIGACSRLLNERASPLAPFIELVARIRFRIRRLQRLENFGYRAMAVVVIQSNHECTSFLQTLPSYKKATLAGNLACSLAPTASFVAMRDSMTERSASRRSRKRQLQLAGRQRVTRRASARGTTCILKWIAVRKTLSRFEAAPPTAVE